MEPGDRKPQAADDLRRRPRWTGARPDPRAADLGAVGPWLLSYVDIISLLVALFVVLLSVSQFDAATYRSVLDSLQSAARNKPMRAVPPLSAPPGAGAMPRATEPAGNAGAAITDALRQGVAAAGMAQMVEIRQRKGAIEMTIRESVLFPSGVADLTAEGERVLASLAPVLAQGSHALSVAGHSDSVPIASDRFPSNWELSSARAASVVRFLIDGGVEPTRLTVLGHGETRPVAGNDTEEGRARNRRVNIILQLPEH